MKNGPYELLVAPEDYPGKKYRGRYVYEHHLVWWQTTGTLVPEDMLIHHKNEQKRDNRFENLELMLRSSHSRNHHTGPKYGTVFCTCAWCDAVFEIPSREYSSRRRAGNKNIFCSRSHAVKHQRSIVSKEVVHGTINSYINKGCRCDLCRKANAAKQQSYRAMKNK